MRGSRGGLVPLALVAALMLVVTAGCGDGDEGAGPSPSASPSATVGPSPTGTATVSPTPTSQSDVSVYFLKGEKVQPVRRKVAGPGVGAAAVRSLLLGPTPGERAAGLGTTIPAGTTLKGLDIKGGLATVDLSGGYAAGGGSLSMFTRLAEVVFTLTQFPAVDRVAFELDGEPVTTFSSEGIEIGDPQRRSDYEDQSPAVLVESPRWGEPVRSPVRVTGTANVFEAVFFVELRDARGGVLVTQRVMASSGTGTRGTFDVTLRPAVTDPGAGTLRTFVYSAKDGSRQDVSSIPVTLVR